MESPASWDLLTSSLAISDLKFPFEAWAFLVVQGLVSDSDQHREMFVEIVRHEQKLDVTGPSVPARVALKLFQKEIAQVNGEVSDPWAKCAAQRLETIASWSPEAVGHRDLERIREWRCYASEQ